jgi:iron(III) transport system substrate-binding protein
MSANEPRQPDRNEQEETMTKKSRAISRRMLLQLSAAAGAYAAGGVRITRAAPEASPVTPQLIEAAKKEGKAVWYTAVDIGVAEKVGKAFEAKYPGVSIRVERSGAERIFQRIGQEYSSRIYTADVINSSDAAHFIIWKRSDWLAPYLPEDVAKNYAPEQRDVDGMYASWRVSLTPMGYNTSLVKKEEAPKSFADLLDPKWKGKIVKAHPSYSGTILTSTFQMVRDMGGWGYFEGLAKQNILQVQSSTEPPKKLALGERAIMADGNEYNLLQLQGQGQPVAPIYPTEGTPLVIGPSAVLKNAASPNAARLFQSYLFSAESQQMLVDVGDLRSLHKQVKEKAGHTPLSQIKVMKEDPAGVEQQMESIKEHYTKLFHT